MQLRTESIGLSAASERLDREARLARLARKLGRDRGRHSWQAIVIASWPTTLRIEGLRPAGRRGSALPGRP